MQCFSIPKNWDRLSMVHTDPDANQLKCMNGMRFFSMIAVVVCHSFMASSCGFVSNPQYMEKMTSDPKAMLFLNGHTATQTFFVMSGWLLSYHFFLTFEKVHFQFTYILYAFVHRYVRLTIPLAVVVAINATWLPHLARGPVWDQAVGNEYRSCRKNWWANLLYVNNYYEERNMCLPHSWYLAADTQLFLYSLLLLSIIWKNRRIASKVFAASLIMGVLVPGILAYIHDIHIVLRAYPENLQTRLVNLPEWSYFMVPGHTSIGGYTIGLIGGYLYYKNRNKKLFAKTYQHILWFVVVFSFPLTVILLGLLLHDDNYTPSSLETAVYVGLSRNLYAFGMCLMIFGFTQNIGWLVNDIVMIPDLQFLGKFSYCVYLVHFTIILIRSGHTRSTIYISDPEMIHRAIGDVVISTVFGVVLCLFVEMPTSALEKLIMSKERKSKVG
uniref:Acyltransferase 3 domain-containing protein n=1 Tax=Photinus pyralis TaxID=7054 RepID=A0A1Y1K397_PHOPY